MLDLVGHCWEIFVFATPFGIKSLFLQIKRVYLIITFNDVYIFFYDDDFYRI